MAPQKRYGHSACLVKNKMYIFGGFDKSNLQTFYECTFKFGTPMDEGTSGLNGLLFSWDKIKAEAPRARDSHSFIHVSNCRPEIITLNPKQKIYLNLNRLETR